MNDATREPPHAAPQDWQAWRRQRRRELIDRRKALDPADRRERSAAIDHWLESGFGPVAGHDIGFCWPFAAEPEPRFAVRRWRETGSRAALPVVVAPRTPLEFREWWPGAPMEKGVYDIPHPVGTDVILPVVALVPVNGFDRRGYRLGYGGGYFDRTLASFTRRPLCIGLGFEIARMETISPQPHDIPFDFIVTESGIHQRHGGGIERVSPETATDAVEQRLAARAGSAG